MEIFSTQFLWALGAIVIIDLVLAGDNAIVIALAARTLPKDLQKKAIIFGTAGAIVVRIVMTLGVLWLLNLPWLRLAGGVLLIWIAYKLLVDDEHEDSADDAAVSSKQKNTTFWSAIRTIVIADTVMGLDNVLGVAGAAKGDFLLVVLGLAISIPIMIWGSTIILKWIERFPVIIYIGAGVLAWTAAAMICHEKAVDLYLQDKMWLRATIYAVIVIGILGAGYLVKRGRSASKA